MIELSRHTVAVPFLPEAMRGFRVGQLTDIHRSRLTPDADIRAAVDMLNRESLDLIVVTGDFVTARAHIQPAVDLVRPLTARQGVLAILGNHDYCAGAKELTAALSTAGLRVLINESVILPGGLAVVGLDDDRHGHPDTGKAFAGTEGRATLALIHNPRYAEQIRERPCVALSGHTHGGQILLPWLTRRELKRIGAGRYRAGWYDVGAVRLYVSRGIGNSGIGLRFLCRPEVSVFELEPAQI